MTDSEDQNSSNCCSILYAGGQGKHNLTIQSATSKHNFKKLFNISVIYKALRQFKSGVLSLWHSFGPSLMSCIWLYQCVHTQFLCEIRFDMYSCLLCFKFHRVRVSLVHNEYRVIVLSYVTFSKYGSRCVIIQGSAVFSDNQICE